MRSVDSGTHKQRYRMIQMAECECYFCEAQSTLDDAVENGWHPSFYVGDDEELTPVCPACAEKHLEVGTDGEMQFKLEVVSEPTESSSDDIYSQED